METAIEQSTPVTDQGFSAAVPVETSDMQQAMRQEHGGQEAVQQPGQSDGLYAGKYQSVEALVDGYKNLQSSYDSRYGGFTGAPEGEYKYTPHPDLVDSEYKLDPKSDSMQRFNSLAKELSMSQDSYDHLMNIYTHEMNTQLAQSAHDAGIAEQESYENYIADLGGNEESVHRQTEDMIVKLARIPGMTDESIESLIGNLQDSTAFTAIQQILSQLEYSSVPGSSGVSPGMSENDLMARMKEAMGMQGMQGQRAMEEVNRLYEQYYPGTREN